MGIAWHRRLLKPFGAVFLLILLFFGIFLFRRPVLMLSDDVFGKLYGRRREGQRARALSRALFRPVKTVRVAAAAGPDAVVLALSAAAQAPYCVLFPFPYVREAERYVREYPDIPVLVLGDGGGPSAPAGLRFWGNDRRTDYYRAGQCAALLGPEGTILVFRESPPAPEERDAFLEGLRARGYEEMPVYVNGRTGMPPENPSCAVIDGPAPLFFEWNLRIPVILFSWIDPLQTSGDIKLIFDDSPWVLAPEAVKQIPRGDFPGQTASRPAVVRSRIPKKLAGALEKTMRDRMETPD
jgi:hypothetical protein